MKILKLSLMATLALSAALSANTITLYTDPATGQVFTTPADGRVKMGDFVDAKTVEKENKVQDNTIAKIKSKSKGVGVFAKASKLQFSGQHYLGYVSQSNKTDSDKSNFEMRRNYIQVKAYLLDDPKSYMRFTLDETTGNGSNDLRIKYAYLYLNDILPYTGVEVGQVHRPWLDYEEHQGWFHRAVDKTFTESAESADLTNSADVGVNFKTKTPYFQSEIGVFNGEGYHTADDGKGASAEWRLTATMLGNGNQKRHSKKTTYLDASFWGQYNVNNASNDDETYKIYGFHAVYNTPSFLVSAQYNIADNDNDKTANSQANRMHHNGKGYSVNGDYRFGSEYQFDLFARYDHWTAEDTAGTKLEYDIEHALYGIGWEQNKNVIWYLNGKYYDPQDGVNFKGSATKSFNSAMVTAEINW
jgi:hypothetical protein